MPRDMIDTIHASMVVRLLSSANRERSSSEHQRNLFTTVSNSVLLSRRASFKTGGSSGRPGPPAFPGLKSFPPVFRPLVKLRPRVLLAFVTSQAYSDKTLQDKSF